MIFEVPERATGHLDIPFDEIVGEARLEFVQGSFKENLVLLLMEKLIRKNRSLRSQGRLVGGGSIVQVFGLPQCRLAGR